LGHLKFSYKIYVSKNQFFGPCNIPPEFCLAHDYVNKHDTKDTIGTLCEAASISTRSKSDKDKVTLLNFVFTEG
jgi:hypothetical protein